MGTKKILGLGTITNIQSLSAGYSVGIQSASYDITAAPANLVDWNVSDIETGIIVSSADSVEAFHSTLFEDFNLKAVSTYNFITDDELSPTSFDMTASLDGLPRYITVSWNTAPVNTLPSIPSKAFRNSTRVKNIDYAIADVKTANTALANGYISPGTIRALLSSPVDYKQLAIFDHDVFLSSQNAGSLTAAEAMQKTDAFNVQPINSGSTKTRVSFIDSSIAGIAHENRINASNDHLHLAAAAALTKLVPNLEIISEFNQDVEPVNIPPKFQSPPNIPGVVYIGYVLEKYESLEDGSVNLISTVNIDDITVSSFIDREVAFSKKYAYRIKSIVQWSRPQNIDFSGKLALIRPASLDLISPNNSWNASFYSGDWSEWARTEVIDDKLPSFPDEFTVRPVSRKGQVHITWKMPWDPQKDIKSFVLLKSIKTENGYTDWQKIKEFGPSNGIFIDSDVLPQSTSGISYVYSMYSTTHHNEHSTLSERVEVILSDPGSSYEIKVNRVGPAGHDPFDHADIDDKKPTMEVTAENLIKFAIRSGNSSLPLFKRTYAVGITSLSTGEKSVINLNADSIDVRFGTSKG